MNYEYCLTPKITEDFNIKEYCGVCGNELMADEKVYVKNV
jgi:hypothetical protein